VKTFFDDIKDFHEKFNLHYDGKPRVLEPDLGDFRINFMIEELTEYIEAEKNLRLFVKDGHSVDLLMNMEKAFDALVDLVYVALGTAYLHGFDFNEGWRRVQEANMKKIRALREEDSKRGSIYDVVKPQGWKSPSHKDLIEDHAHR
jgi:predicted HAD superfamily Cof-like phosphohydrolase